MRLIRLQNVLAMLVAAALQMMPLLRVAPSVLAPVAGPLAIILRWATYSAAVMGGFHAVSGASTTITSAKTATGKVGVAFSYRITTGPYSANLFAAAPLPPGLAVNPPGKNGFIMGTPTAAGVTTVKLTVSDSGRLDRTISTNLVITITASATAPTILVPPKSVSTVVGSSPTLSVTAGGTAPITYQWKFGSAIIPDATNASLTLTNVQVAAQGDYYVVLSNSAGTTSSLPAHLTVIVPVPLALLNPRLEGNVFKFHVQGTPNASFVLWKSADLVHWSQVLTNQISTTLFDYTDPDLTLDRTDFYQATQVP